MAKDVLQGRGAWNHQSCHSPASQKLLVRKEGGWFEDVLALPEPWEDLRCWYPWGLHHESIQSAALSSQPGPKTQAGQWKQSAIFPSEPVGTGCGSLGDRCSPQAHVAAPLS